MKRNFAHKGPEILASKLTLDDVPSLMDATIPYFCSLPSAFPAAPPGPKSRSARQRSG